LECSIIPAINAADVVASLFAFEHTVSMPTACIFGLVHVPRAFPDVSNKGDPRTLPPASDMMQYPLQRLELSISPDGNLEGIDMAWSTLLQYVSYITHCEICLLSRCRDDRGVMREALLTQRA
jgi:hypothetical protein